MAAVSAERYDALVQWVEEEGGGLHPSVEIYQDEATKGSFRVKAGCALAKGDAVVRLPLSRSLSYLNAVRGHPAFPGAGAVPHLARPSAENSPYFPDEFLAKTPPHVVSRFFLVQQYLLGADSLWWPYIRTLPQPEHMAGALPALWPVDDVEFLAGTNAYVAVQEIKATLRKEYKEAMKLLPDRYKAEYNRPLYLWAYSVFTSRSFRPSLILPFTDEDGPELPCPVDDFSVLLPLFDVGNHAPQARAAWSTDPAGRTCRLQAEQPYAAGAQVYNHYGLKTNAELLLGYGFVLPEAEDFHNDYVHVKTKPNPEEGDLAATHIVALRPMADPSSLVGRARLLAPDLEGGLGCWAHVQDSLVVLLYETIVKGTADEPAAGEGQDGQDNDDADADAITRRVLPDVLRGNIPAAVKMHIIEALGSKLSMDLEELDQNEPEYEPANRNQRMAVEYRDQCRKVLERALLSLSDPEKQ